MYYEVHGRPDAPTVVLSSGLGGSAQYWTPQIPVLAAHFRVIAYDQHGTGRSPGTMPQGYTVGDMAAGLAATLDLLGVTTCHFVGHALGGLIGLRLALDRPNLIKRLVVVNAWAKTHPHTLRCFAIRRSLLLDTGIEAYVKAQPLFLYPAWWLADRPDWLAEQDAAGVAHFPPRETVLRRIAAAEAFEIDPRSISAPTLAVAARDDLLVPWGCSQALAQDLQHGEIRLMEQGGHACNVTAPDEFNDALMRFLRAP